MKKILLSLTCLVTIMFFASCTQEQIDDFLEKKPNVAFVEAEGFISTNTSMFVGTELNFQIKVSPNAGSESPLASLSFEVMDNLSGETVFTDNPEITDPNGESLISESFTPTYASNYTITATVKDEAGKMNIATIIIDYVQPTSAEIGVFEGTLVLNGHISTIQEYVGYQLDQDLDPIDLPTSITLGSVEDGERIKATFVIDGSPVSLYCTQDGENLLFDEFHFTKTINIILDINLDFTVNATGILTGNTLTLTGETSGTGSVNIPVINPQVSMTGEISGTLENKAE